MRSVWLAALMSVAMPAQAAPDPAVGQYEAQRMEMAAFLALKPDHRFEYALAYGALNEEAAGSWRRQGDAILLTSDPMTPPSFAWEAMVRAAPKGIIRAKLIVPKGMEPQFFDFVLDPVALNDPLQVDSQGKAEIAYDPKKPPRAIRVQLGIYDLVSEPLLLNLKDGGADIAVRFTPNDLGRVAFKDTPIALGSGELWVERFGERIRFVRRDGR